jgi:hypothetical protein
MAEGRSVRSFVVCMVLFFLIGFILSDEKSHVIVSHLRVTEHDMISS